MSELATVLRQAAESAVGQVWVKGEVTGLKVYQSGHWYFTLRDADSQLKCVMWQTYTRRMKSLPAEGTEVFTLATPTVWPERGELRLRVVTVLPTAGVGIQQLEFARTRDALERDGLLDPATKRALPPFPRAIALVTSPDGAVLRDIVTVARRRWPAATLVLVGAKVQGDEAVDELVAALGVVGRLSGIDACIVARGGGSREDLSAFNAEPVCRAVAAVPVPTISAVGHETDVTLTDLVADVRAPTPSAAAAMALPDRAEVARQVASLATRLAHGLSRRTRVLAERLARAGDRLEGAMGRCLVTSRGALDQLTAQLDALSPLKVLARGYGIARLDGGVVVKRVAQLPPGRGFTLRVTDGEVPARAE